MTSENKTTIVYSPHLVAEIKHDDPNFDQLRRDWEQVAEANHIDQVDLQLGDKCLIVRTKDYTYRLITT